LIFIGKVVSYQQRVAQHLFSKEGNYLFLQNINAVENC